MTGIWEEIKNHIKTELPTKSFSLWINPITLIEENENKLVLGCPNKFSIKWVKENYRGIIEETINQMSDNRYELAFKVVAAKKRKPSIGITNDSNQLTLKNLTRARIIGKPLPNRDFTFDRFVVGKCNEFAYSVSRAMALGDHWPHNHLYMQANTGLGKSHLSQAIGHAILEQNSKVRVCYITAEDFVNEMIFSLKNNRIEEFKNKYRRSCDVLLLEEVHFFSGKEKTQLELEYTLNALANDNKKIIFTSSMLPKNIPNLTKELSSRLTSGIITTLEPPDYETRVKILKKKAKEHNLNLPDDITHLLAKHLTRDIRHMESALRCLKAKSELLNVEINTDLAGELIKCHLPEQNSISMEKIRELVCKYFKVTPGMLHSKSRKRIHSLPRNIYVFLCRNYTESTVEDIGRTINRNHSTVLYALDSIEQKMRLDRKIKNQVRFLKEKVKTVGNDIS